MKNTQGVLRSASLIRNTLLSGLTWGRPTRSPAFKAHWSSVNNVLAKATEPNQTVLFNDSADASDTIGFSVDHKSVRTFSGSLRSGRTLILSFLAVEIHLNTWNSKSMDFIAVNCSALVPLSLPGYLATNSTSAWKMILAACAAKGWKGGRKCLR